MRNPDTVRGFPAGSLMPGNSDVKDSSAGSRYAGPMVRIVSQGGSILAAPDQPIFVRPRKHRKGLNPIILVDSRVKIASEVDDSDYICVPVMRKKLHDSHIDLTELIRTGTDSLGRNTFSNRAVKTLQLTADMAWLIGLYVAEGDASPHVRFSLSSAESDIMDRVESVAASAGYSASRSYSKSQKACAVTLGATVFGRWLKENCGARAQQKRIPSVIMAHADPIIRRAFIDGLMDGDGCRSSNATGAPRWILRQSSKALMYDLVLLLAQDAMGVHASQSFQRPRSIRGRSLPLTPVYSVSWNPEGVRPTERTMNGRTIMSTSHRWKSRPEGVWYPVKSVLHEAFDGFIYDPAGASTVNGIHIA